MLRTLRFVRETNLVLPSLSPIQYSKNTFLKPTFFLKNAENVEIYQEKNLGLQSFSPIQYGQNTCEILKLDIFSKMLRKFSK